MAQGGVLGNDTRVGYSGSSPVSWTRINQLMEVGFPSMTPDDIDNTVHGSGNFHSSMPGLIEVGDMELTILSDLDHVTNPQFDTLWQHRDAGTLLFWRIEVPVNRDKTRFRPFEFQGTVADFNPGTPIADKQTLDITIRVQGGLSKFNATSSPAIA